MLPIQFSRVLPVFRLFSIPLLVTAGLFSNVSAHAQVEVLTSIKPLQLIAAAVQEGAGKPAVLLPPGASPHHYAMRPSDVRQLRSADLFYWIGPDMEGFLAPVLKGRDGPSIAIQSLPGLTLRHFGESSGSHDDHDHEDEHAHDEHLHEAHGDHDEHEHDDGHSTSENHADNHDEHDHDHRPGSLDAHLWLLPSNAVAIAEAMAKDMAKADPDNAQRYAANLAAFKQRLANLDERLGKRLDAVRTKPFFVFHEAYDYFESAYNIKHAGVFSAGGEAQPGARHVAAMRERLEQAGPSCVFYEPPTRPRLADSLIRGLPVKVAELDALGYGIDASADGYEQLIDNIGSALAGCLESL